MERQNPAFPAEVGELLPRLLEGQRLALGDRPVATYLFGSVSGTSDPNVGRALDLAIAVLPMV